MSVLRLAIACVGLLVLSAIFVAANASAMALTGVMSWGDNEFGQLGNGGYISLDEPRITLPEPEEVTAVAAGGFYEYVFGYALLKNGAVYSWGEDEHGQLGRSIGKKCGSERGIACSATPGQVTKLENIIAISASTGGEFGLALNKEGKVYAWGDNKYGQLGNGSTSEDSKEPVEVRAEHKALSGVTAISAGENGGLALNKEGKVYAWGENSFGELGVGSATGPEECSGRACSREAVEVEGLNNVVAIAAGTGFDLALVREGSTEKVMAWGENAWGELGQGTSTGPEECLVGGEKVACSTKPVEVKGLSGVTAIAAGGEVAFAIFKEDALSEEEGRVMAWGSNLEGKLGHSSGLGPEECSSGGPCSTKPAGVKGITSAKAISAGENFVLALVGEGKVMAWGDNRKGELGQGSFAGPEECENATRTGAYPCSRVPAPVGEVVDAKGVSAGGFTALLYGPGRPSISGLVPRSGPPSGETKVRITGYYLSGVTKVMFGSAEAKEVHEISEDELEVTSPPGTGVVHVFVTTSEGTLEPSFENEASIFKYVGPGAPEFGRCKKVATGTGKYSNSACTTKDPGSYEWYPGTDTHFTLTGSLGERENMVTLETVGKKQIVCSGASGEGEYAGTKEVAKVILRFTGCEVEEPPYYPYCTSAGAAEAEIVTSVLHGGLGWTDKEKGTAGLDLASTETSVPFAEFECEGYTKPIAVRGSVTTSYDAKMNKMAGEFVLQYKESHGHQEPKEIEIEGKPLTDILESTIGGALEPTGLRVTFKQVNEEPVEVNGTV